MPSSLDRPLPIRVRPDLIVQPLEFSGRRHYGIKDPLTLKYFHLREEEHAILLMLDGRTSVDAIRRQFERRFSPRRLGTAQLQSFLGMLHAEGLVLSETAGQGGQLLAKGRVARRKSLLSSLANPLALRFRGFDPQPFLDAIEPWCRWIFSPLALAVAILLVVSAAGLICVRLETLRGRLPDFQAFFGLRNVVLLAATLASTKILHELGHALACRHFGGECHEMGVMLLVFTPALYCNVSDAWMLPNKWHRAAIGAAGMIVELVLAAAAAWLWWFSEPGMFNALCLNVMFVCSLSTVLFNGNPLLRYDGYYVLGDLLEVPNLQEQSKAVVRQWLGRFFLGLDLHPVRMLPPRGHAWLFWYGIASTLYRWLVVLGILWFVHRVLQPWRLEVIAQWMAVLILGGQFLTVTVRTVRFLSSSARRQKVRWSQFWVRGIAAGLVAAFLLLVPLPYPVSAPAVVQPRDAVRVYIAVPGKLVSAVQPGTRVSAGEPLAELQNADLLREVTQLEGEQARLALRLSQLQLQQGTDADAAAQLDVTREALAGVTRRLQERKKDQERLTPRAMVSGVVLSARDRPSRTPAGDLPSWTGDPLDERNRGGFLAAGTMLCLIGDPRRLEALLVVDQSDVDLVSRDQRVILHLDENPGQGLSGTIAEIAQVELQAAPGELAAQGDLAIRSDPEGGSRPRSTSYQARVRIDDVPANLTHNASGWATISVAPQSLATHLGRYLTRTFRFEAAVR